MSKPNDGGPAFPVISQEVTESGQPYTECMHRGMSLRDWFAGQALAGFLANMNALNSIDGAANGDQEVACTMVGLACYAHADGVIAARSGK